MIKLPLYQRISYGDPQYVHVDPAQIESIADETRPDGIGRGLSYVCTVTMKSGQQHTTTKGAAEIHELVATMTMSLPEIQKAQVLHLLPGDVLVVTTRDGRSLTEEERDWMAQKWRRLLPGWVTVAVVQGCDVKVVRDGRPETKAERIKKAGGESWQAEA